MWLTSYPFHMCLCVVCVAASVGCHSDALRGVLLTGPGPGWDVSADVCVSTITVLDNRLSAPTYGLTSFLSDHCVALHQQMKYTIWVLIPSSWWMKFASFYLSLISLVVREDAWLPMLKAGGGGGSYSLSLSLACGPASLSCLHRFSCLLISHLFVLHAFLDIYSQRALSFRQVHFCIHVYWTAKPWSTFGCNSKPGWGSWWWKLECVNPVKYVYCNYVIHHAVLIILTPF